MIRIVLADPTRVEVEALIRSVGSDLEACTPVDQAVGAGAGEAVTERLLGMGEVPVGGALVTPGGDLVTPLLIHVVVRSPDEPVSEASVVRALENGLRRAVEWEVEVLGVPPLGIGAGNLDAEASARVMCAVLDHHMASARYPREVVLIVANAYEQEAFAREMERDGSRLRAPASPAGEDT